MIGARQMITRRTRLQHSATLFFHRATPAPPETFKILWKYKQNTIWEGLRDDGYASDDHKANSLTTSCVALLPSRNPSPSRNLQNTMEIQANTQPGRGCGMMGARQMITRRTRLQLSASLFFLRATLAPPKPSKYYGNTSYTLCGRDCGMMGARQMM